jgi:hypothetical protein
MITHMLEQRSLMYTMMIVKVVLSNLQVLTPKMVTI